MYSIDFLTCSAADLIERSLVMHPSLFREAVEKAEAAHTIYATNHPLSPGALGARMAAKDCAAVLSILSGPAGDDAKEAAKRIAGHSRGIGPCVQAVTVAGKLQCVPPALRGEIAERSSAA